MGAIIVRLLCYLGILLSLVGHGLQQNAPYDDYSWIRRMGIVGDSYTAGIGAGVAERSSGVCARYSGSWATRMTHLFTRLSANNIFNYACSGAKTPEISEQVSRLPGNLDLVVLTAGGNDLCLSALLTSCILSPFATQEGCQEIIRLAQHGLDTYLEENVRTVLEQIIPKMRRSGMIILAGYAQFFDATTDACTDETWSIGEVESASRLRLTRSLRAQMNTMVRQANVRLARAVRRMDRASNDVRVGFADWDEWPGISRGRFCVQGTDTNPRNTPIAQFIKLDTRPWRHDDLRRRDLSVRDNNDNDHHWNQTARTLEFELARRSGEAFLVDFAANATTAAQSTSTRPLQGRAITEPNCPAGFRIVNEIVSYLDFLGSVFHPTMLGHQAMMTFALQEVRTLRAQQLGIPGPGCGDPIPDCIGIPARAVAYASRDAVDSQLSGFCNEVGRVIQRSGSAPFSVVREFHRGSPDHVRLTLSFDTTVGWPRPGDFSATTCVDTLRSLIRACVSVNPAANPRYVLTGGDQRISLWHYDVTPVRSGRIWPPPLAPRVEVKGNLYSTRNAVMYEIRGTGFATWDFGQSTLRASFAQCDGRQPVSWSFRYLHPPQDGFEWVASIQSTADRLTCMTSGEVIRNAGGPAGSTVQWQSNRPDAWVDQCPDVEDWDTISCFTGCCKLFVPCSSWCVHFCGGLLRDCNDKPVHG